MPGIDRLTRQLARRLVDSEHKELQNSIPEADRDVARFNAYVNRRMGDINKIRESAKLRVGAFALTDEERAALPHVKKMTRSSTSFDTDYKPDGVWKTAMVERELDKLGSFDKTADTYQVTSLSDEVDAIVRDYERTRLANNERGRMSALREAR